MEVRELVLWICGGMIVLTVVFFLVVVYCLYCSARVNSAISRRKEKAERGRRSRDGDWR